MATGRFPTTANSPLETKGDLFTYSTGSAKLAVGNNGETLVADSSTSTGLRYQAIQTRNCVYNSQMEVWQRGTSFTANGYSADRWYFSPNGIAGRTLTRQAGTGQFQYLMRVARDSGNSNTSGITLGQSFEIADSTPFAGKTVTLSFYARAGANFSPTGGLLNYYVFSGTSSTETNRIVTAYPSGGVTVSAATAALTTTLTRYQSTFTFGAGVTQFCIDFDSLVTGTAGAADYYEITGVQLEVGSVATNYVRQGGTIQGELSACMRYYQTVNSFTGNASTTAQINAPLTFVMPMRTSPSVAGSAGGLYVSDGTNDFQQSSTNVAFVNGTRVSSQNCQLLMQNFTGMTQWRSYMNVSTVGATLQFSAEL